MVRDTDGTERSTDDDRTDVSRRNLMKLAGAGTGIAALGGASLVAGQEGGGDEGDDETGGGTGDDDHLLDDLVDPVFGYPLAGGEGDDVSLEHVVDATMADGEGAHEDFPEEPDPDAPGQFVEIPAEFYFDPVGIHVEPDALVQFEIGAGLHTVTAFHEKFGEPEFDVPTRVPDDVPGFTSPPATPGESWVYRFTEPGVYDLFCFPHLGLGMVMRVVVFDPDDDDIDDDEFEAPTAGPLFPNVERVLTAPELDPETIVEEGTVAWEDLTLEEETETETETETATETDTPEGETDTPTEEPETDTPGTETAGTETEVPGTETDIPGTDTDTPGNETTVPGTDSPGTGSPPS